MMNLIFLTDFNVIRPDWGLLLWTTVVFALFWLVIGKYAFRPIAEALKKREDDIQGALDLAKKAKDDMANLVAENDALMAETREERAKILKEASDLRNNILKEAKDKAKEEAQKIVLSATQEIENQKKAALAELKGKVGNMAIEIAEKLIKKDLKGNSEHELFVGKLVDEVNLN